MGPRGAETAELLFSANPGEDLRPLAKVVSGGELSRTMLAVKTVLAAADDVPVLVFDEVDAGIGGRVADVVGQKLAPDRGGAPGALRDAPGPDRGLRGDSTCWWRSGWRAAPRAPR